MRFIFVRSQPYSIVEKQTFPLKENKQVIPYLDQCSVLAIARTLQTP